MSKLEQHTISFNISLLKALASQKFKKTKTKKHTTRGQQNQSAASLRNLRSFDFARVHDWLTDRYGSGIMTAPR